MSKENVPFEYSYLAQKYMQVVDLTIGQLGTKDHELYEEIVEIYDKLNQPHILAPASKLTEVVIQYGMMAKAYKRLWAAVENGEVKESFFELRKDYRNYVNTDHSEPHSS